MPTPNPDDDGVVSQAEQVAARAAANLSDVDDQHPVRKAARTVAIYLNTLLENGVDERAAVTITRHWMSILHHVPEGK